MKLACTGDRSLLKRTSKEVAIHHGEGRNSDLVKFAVKAVQSTVASFTGIIIISWTRSVCVASMVAN